MSLQEQFTRAVDNAFLHLIVLPTEQCNFRCTYCYEDFSCGRMKPQTVLAIERLIEARFRSGLRRLHISWFGGEPLLALPIIESISRSATHAAQAAVERQRLEIDGHSSVTADMTSNGFYLRGKTTERLVECGVSNIQISLDGPGELHDTTRVKINGGGSFDVIWSNLVELQATDLPLQIFLRLHVTPDNASEMPTFVRTIRDQFLSDPRFHAFIKPIERMGGPGNENIATLSRADRAMILPELRSILESSPQGSTPFVADDICYAAKPNSLIVRSTGALSKCTVALSSADNNVGRIEDDGSLNLDSERLTPWFRGWSDLDASALGCPLSGLTNMRTSNLLPVVARGPLLK